MNIRQQTVDLKGEQQHKVLNLITLVMLILKCGNKQRI